MMARGQPLVGSNILIRRPNFVRAWLAPATLAAALMLGGCKTEGVFPANMKANAPIPPALLSEMESKNMAKESPILVRIFKQEAELEVWKQDRTGRYALLKTYPVCRWSGDLGPKIKEGDRQAPEGFYDIAPGQMNPNSSYYLAFNLGYPNAYDRAHGRTGAHLMVHGDCSSRGCYAMSDEQIQEIFAMGRESFFGGQKSFQVQAYPFRMTPANMAKHRNSPHFAFWKMLKQGNDHFEVTRQEPKVDVCEKRYVFNSSATRFDPRGKCPALDVPQEVADAVNDKQRNDELQFATLVSRNTPVAPITSNRDGGMHPKFVAALRPTEVVDEKGKIRLVVDPNVKGPGTISASDTSYASASDDRAQPVIETTATIAAADVPVPRAAPQPKVGSKPEEPSFGEKLANFFRPAPKEQPVAQVASVEQPKPAPKPSILTRITTPRAPTAPAAPAEASSQDTPKKESLTTRVARTVGLRGSDTSSDAAKPVPAQSAQPSATSAWPAQAQAAPATTAASPNFESRWGAFR